METRKKVITVHNKKKSGAADLRARKKNRLLTFALSWSIKDAG
jgi:hypothetical protein